MSRTPVNMPGLVVETPSRAEKLLRYRNVIELYVTYGSAAGIDWELIAEKQGEFDGKPLSVAGTKELFKRAYDKLRDDGGDLAAQALRLDLERLNVAEDLVMSEIRAGNLQAVDKLTTLQARRSKLLGMDAPAKKEVTGPNGSPIQLSWNEVLLDNESGE